jgi:hypothetical protein
MTTLLKHYDRLYFCSFARMFVTRGLPYLIAPYVNIEQNTVTVVGTNLCAWGPLKVNGKGIGGVGGAADREAYTIHTINIISQPQYFVARCLSSCVDNAFGLRSMCVCFPATLS